MNRLRGRGFFFVAAVLWALMVAFLPSVQTGPQSLAASDGPVPAGPAASTPDLPGTGGSVTAAPVTPGGAVVTRPNGQPTAPSGVATGVTRGGIVCKPGVKQIPDTTYAMPCRPKFTGDNGGATQNGVTGTTIKFADRYLGPSLIGSGGALSAPQAQVLTTFLKYFNDNYELYGRRVVLEEYESPHGDALAEATGKGRDAACQDAITLAQEHHDFGVIYSQSQVFEACAAEQHLIVMDAEGRPTEPFLQQHDPYLWTYEQECDRIAYGMGEYVGKRLANRPAIHAGDESYRTRTRKFGVMVPDSPSVQPCLAIVKRELANRYDVRDVVEFDFQADPSTLSDQTARAAIKFKAEGVTTIVMGTDPISFQFMTQSAHNQNWFPEWINIGIAGDDSDASGQSYDQAEVDGHMFGRTEYVNEHENDIRGSEADNAYLKLTGKHLPDGGAGSYFFLELTHMFNMLQGAGPNLTPYSIGQALRHLETLSGAFGQFSYQFNPDGSPGFSHASMLDANEIWYDGDIAGANGEKGGWHTSPQRYLQGQWPTTPPNVYGQ